MTASHDATFYVQLSAKFGQRWLAGNYVPTVSELRLVTATKNRPDPPRPGTVTCKLTLRVPDAAFLPLAPEAVVVVPEDMVITSPIEVEAGDMNEGGAQR